MRVVLPGSRWLLRFFVVLALAAFVTLFVGSTRTADSFAWTISPPLTAAFLGAGYSGALTLFALAVRERLWADARVAFAGPLALSTLTVIATLIHLGKFHLHADPVAATVAWVWLVVYCLAPPAIVLLAILQARSPGDDPAPTGAVPAGLRAAMVIYGIGATVGGIFMFAVPRRVAPHWPWAITPLTGQAIAAWIFGLGVAALLAALERDLRRIRAGLAAVAVIGGLGLIAVLRYSTDVRWNPGGSLVVAVLAVMLATGAYGWWRARAPSSSREPRGPGRRPANG